MVRETRHLWVGNLPENIREDRIRDHFKRYGRVQSVKLLPRGEECPVDGGSSSSLGEGNEGGSGSNSGGGGGGGGGSSSTNGGASATVAFMDIKSAAKAHAIEHTLDERILTTQYYEPQHLQPRFASRGSSEDHGSSGGSGGGGGGTGGVSGGGGGGSGSTGAGVGGSGTGGERGERGSESFDSRGSHGSFYSSDRNSRVVGGSSGGAVVGGGGGVGGHPADPATGDPGGYISRGRPPASSYHVTSSRARDRLYPRSGPYITGPPPPPPHLDRHRGSLPPSSWSAYEPAGSRYGGAPPPPSPATNDAYQDEQGVGGGGGSGSSSTLRQHKKQRRKSRSGSSSPSGSSRSGSSSSSRSGSSGGSSSGSTSPGSPVSPHRTSNAAVAEDRRPLAICVRNLPIRSSDTSLKDGLFHEYKKHGKVTWVKVVGSGDDRYALVCFKKPEDVEKALEVSQDKLFFGCKIEVAPYQGYDVEDNEFRPYEAELDEYHPKATRTLFIGNLEKDVTASELRKHFEPFGEIIEIDIKKQGAVSSYAFCQYSDIGSVVKAMRSMDGEHLGANRIKLGFGKSMPTACVWVDGIGDGMSEKYLNMQFHQFGSINQVAVDRERGHALVFFDQISCAQTAVKEMRGAALRGRRLQVDFASRECQETFYEHLERQGNSTEKTWESRPSPASSFDVVTRERSSFDSAVTVSSSSSRFTRYDTPPRSRTASYSRTSGGSTPGASPAHPTAMSRSSRRSYQDSYYDGDYGEPTPRRFRSYDEFSQGSGTSHDDYQSSVLSDGKLNDDECPPPSRRHTVQSVVTNIDPPALPPPLLPPPDIRHLQKERVHLLEQLEECQSSGDEVGFVPKKRAKLDSSSTTILCEDDEPEIASLLVTSHSSRKSIEFRRVSDSSKVVVHHGTRRSSCEGRGPAPCKRRRDATSRHHEHHDGSRPGTPLVDERPENLVPSEPRRFRERSHEGPLSLPLPRFAAQMLNNNNNNNNNNNSNNNNGSSATRLSSASLSKVASPPCASLSTAPSPRAAPQPPASPPPRHTSSSPTSSDSETAPQSPTLEERIRSLDEMYEKWSGSRALSAASGDALAKLDVIVSERFRFPHKLLENDYKGVEPSEIMKSVLAKRSVFEEDSKRLENFSEKYEPREFTGVSSMIGSTAGLTTSGGCTGKVCLQYPFPSHPPVQSTSGASVNSQVGINTSALSANMIPTTTVAPSTLKTDPRMVHICVHPTPATPITPGTSVKTVSPELPPVSLPIGLGSGTVANGSGNGSDLASASSLLSGNGSVSNIHTLGASTHRGLTASVVAAVDTSSASVTTTIPVTKSCPIQTIMTTSATTTTTSATDTFTSMTSTVCSVATASSTTALSTSSSLSSSSQSSTELPRSRLKKENGGSGRESRDSRDGKDSRESKHNKGKDCQRRSLRKEEIDVERNRKDRDERENTNVANDIGNADTHSRDFKDNKELRYERKERDKEDRDRQERKEKEDRDRQEKKERDEREKREKDEEKREKERLDKERQEKDRKEREEREKERERREKEENELKEKERREKERIDREKREREEKERQERREREERERKEREERERKEREIRLEREKQEKERLRREREEQERRDKEERERLERERRREEKERLERERKREREEKEKLERERRKEKEEREKAEKEKYEKEERERLDKERHEKRREREEQEKREKEKMEREKRRDREEKEKEKRERDDSRRQSTENHLHSTVAQPQTQVVPAPVPVKRRCSSQDGPTDEDAKRMKISDHRRDSKDRSRQNRRSEDRKHRNDSHRSSRDSRDNRDNGNKDSGNVIQDSSRDGAHGDSARENNSRDSGSKEKQKNKRNRSEKESRERSPRVSHESDKEYLPKLELSKRNDSSLPTEPASNHTRDAQHQQQQQQQQQQQHSTLNSHSDIDDCCTHEMQVTRNPSATDTDSDEPKKHSIFDIVVDEPAYISMYDKVKARSTKNMQKLEEEKRQVRLKDKFSQLKQSRARREEKKQSTSWDGDSVSSKALTEDEATSESDSTRTKSLSRKGSRSRIHSDTSEEEEPFNNKVARKPVKTERYIESDVDFNFADTDEKPNSLETPSVVANSVRANIKEEPRTSDEDERISVGFRTNHTTIANNHERDPRKKSHKKKQKRQKNSGNENNLKMESTETLENKNRTNAITSNAADCRPNHGTELNAIATAASIVTTALENEERMRADKKQRSKKDKRRDRNGEDKAKARRKRLNRQEARDSQRMEDIFGPLSDDVDDASSNTFFNRFDNIATENNVYASDSDGGRSSLDMDRVRRKTEKKRRHQLEDENSVDLAEAGREIEAKLLGIPSSPKSAPPACTEPSDHDVFRFTDDNDSIEPSTPSTVPEKVKEKKKKRKKSKEERSRKDYHHHHHHHHHHHEKSGELPYLGAEPSPPRASSPLVSKTVSPSLPTPRETLLSPIPKVTSGISAVTSVTPPAASGSAQTSKQEKKKDKFIPGFGIEIDETIHENAVKSISEPEERDGSCQSRSAREEPELPVQTIPPTQISPDGEDKPRVAISQEETEDAVAALLEETFGASTEDFSYEGEEEEAEADGVAEAPAEAPQEDVEEMQQAVESLNASTGEGDTTDMKPDTPQSEHDLQIDTDTEEDPNYETVDLTQPPKTPDIPSFYKSPTKTSNTTPVLSTPEKSVEVRLSPPLSVTKPRSPPTSVIAHSWTLSENNKSREPAKPAQIETTSDADADACATSPERTARVERASASPPPSQYKQPMLVPCSVPIATETPKSLPLPSSPRPSPIAVQPLYQRLPVSPQSQMVPMRQASPKLQNPTTVSCASTNATPLPPPLVSSRIPSLVMSSQSSPRVSQPLSPNGQWSRNPTLSPHVSNVGKKSSPPPTKIAVCMPIPAHSTRPEISLQQVYSTAATQQPVIQHASGMLAPVPCYPRGGLPPLTLNIPPRPYMPVPPLASGVQVKNSRDSSLGGKSVIETLLPVNPNEPPQRLEDPKLSPAVIPETTHKASTSPKVPSPNQPPTYIPETAKIDITANMPSSIFSKPCYLATDSYAMPSRTQKQISISITTDSNLLSPRQKQEMSNVQLLTTHVPRSSTPSPVIVAHGQSHLLHKSVHSLGPPSVSSPNQPLVKTVVPVVPQQLTPSVPSSMPSDKCVITQTSLACQRQSPVSQSQLVKSHVPPVSTVSQSQSIITRVVPSTVSSVSSVSTSSIGEKPSSECSEPHVIQEHPLELDEARISEIAQPMLLTPPIQTTQPVDEIKQEPIEVKKEDTTEETEYNVADSKEPPNQTCVDDVKPKQELQEAIETEDSPSVPKEADDTVVPKLEPETLQLAIKSESLSETKEERTVKENDDVELDEEPVEDPLKEPRTDPLAIDSKDDPTDSKEDSDYWSAKEVNIESVIKKVDALCDGEGNDSYEEMQRTESANSDSRDTSKNESDWFDAESAESETKKSFASTDDHDESAETCENEVTRSRRGRAKSRRGSRGGGVTTRRGRNASNVSHKRGGRSPRGSKHHVEKSKLPADVYEFHDDSEEDNAGRPRLILTIKSPGPNVTGPNAQPATPVAAVKEVPPEEFVSPAANTRKSRRLAERDGSRNTVDDVIEDVVRGSPANKGLVNNAGNAHATRRSTRHNNTPRNATQPPVVPLTELRKSTRGGRKAARRASENNDDSGEEKPKEVSVATQQENKPSSPNKEESKPSHPENPKAEEPQVAAPAPQKAISLEPMTLIDPVTGMLIPMRESEEGQYIPVSTSGQAQNANKTSSDPRNDRGLIGVDLTGEAPRVKAESAALSAPVAETKKEIVMTEQPSCPPTQQIQPQTSVITKPQSPAVQVTSTVTVAQSSAACTPTSVVTTVIPTTAVQAVPVSSQTKPTSFKAHVLNASKLATSTQQQVAVTKPMSPSLPNQTIVQNIVKPPVQHVQSVQALNLQIPPGRVSSPSLSPCAKQAVQQQLSSNGKQGQPMSPVLNNTGVPPNPKQHLLQAAKQQTTTIVNMLPINLHSNVNAPSSRIHQPVSQPTALKGINGQPHPLNPKAHLLQAVVPPLITGPVTSSPSQPHLVNPQPISTGVSNVRPPGPKAPITSTMEPQKVELPISGCIMPTTSPQARSNPIPTFEAPLHGTGATPPGGQYGLIPPHRSQSPPLPPPAHHHVPTSQSEVVNHYGGLARGELPPHYLHSQMFQYQYHLRAQQEALTAPRMTPYHIPPRSPHLPLDPKLETGLEDAHSPPLELRRGTRTPQDRTTDSPQVAQVYMLAGGVRLPPPPPQYNAGSNPSLPGAPVGARAGYYEPPPAHLRSQYPMPASEAPPEMGRAATPERCRKHQVVTPPPYASQVPPQADSFQMLLQRYPLMWQGLLALKNDQAAVQMHFVFGNPNVARDSLPCNSDGSTPPLRIAQRMRLEQTQVEGVARKMQTDNEHCMLLALPCGRDEVDVLQQSKNLQSGFIMYLQQKQAAGIVNIAVPGSQQPAYVVHIFPSCDFAHENLARIAPDLLHRVAKIAHLLIVIATV